MIEALKAGENADVDFYFHPSQAIESLESILKEL